MAVLLSVTVIIGLTVMGINIVHSSNICAHKRDFYPCRCNPRGFNALICDKISDKDYLMKPLQKASEQNVKEVSLQYSSFNTLPVQLVNFMGFKYLKVKFVKLTNLFEDVLYGRIELEQLQLDNIRTLNPIVWTPLDAFMDLKRFSVLNMKVENIDNKLLQSLTKSLQSVAFISTNTKAIARKAFAEFQNLEFISVQKSEISALRRSMFPSPAKIRYFYFNNNKITSLPSDLFHDMPYLQRIGFQGNLIAEVKQATFFPVWHHLSSLLLSENPLKCHCSMSWITRKKIPDVLTGRCHVPKDKYGKPLWKLKPSDFDCPIELKPKT